MSIFQGAVYALGWGLALNLAWVLHLAASRPARLRDLFNISAGSRIREELHTMSRWRAGAHLWGAFLGVLAASLLIFRALFGFLPGDWGGQDEFGAFVPARDGLAGLAALTVSVIAFRALERSATR
ncbi:hypothetical protein IQ03_01142 [Gemmobacter caeni]|uniref:Uncharacterized protein n=1 Tax=Gemmobacter caeni TaxID=589035 RepID=A0A2T6B8J7_9RHOB|nr:hypothetical protein [Gemmobacter caeni]PTX52352.1 hypothetical protein C8N34_102131 [Gemmobacter caeni]TWJ02724.1 hypothetical protein IQ03_01142 [Gemmobacter caeni]